jgi:hypothetical protein
VVHIGPSVRLLRIRLTLPDRNMCVELDGDLRPGEATTALVALPREIRAMVPEALSGCGFSPEAADVWMEH